MPRILFVSGFHPTTRARDLAYEFERYGPLIRCDVPAPRNSRATSNPYAFIEFRNARDAEDAYYDMHGRHLDGNRISIQWAKNPPSSVWRYDRRSPPRRERGARSRSRSPRRAPRESRDRRDDRDRDRERDRGRDDRDKDREPERERERRRSASPDRDRERRRDDRERDRARTPPPADTGSADADATADAPTATPILTDVPAPITVKDEDAKKEEDHAQTPPYDN